MNKKPRVHREWFRTVMQKRKTCPSCYEKLGDRSVWSWGEYVTGKWRTVQHFCQNCWPIYQEQLIEHANDCHCQFELIGYQGQSLPHWLEIAKGSMC